MNITIELTADEALQAVDFGAIQRLLKDTQEGKGEKEEKPQQKEKGRPVDEKADPIKSEKPACTIDDIRRKFKELNTPENRAALKGILTDLGVPSISKIPESDFPVVLSKLEEMEA